MAVDTYRARLRLERNSINNPLIEYLERMSRSQRGAWLRDAAMQKMLFERKLMSVTEQGREGDGASTITPAGVSSISRPAPTEFQPAVSSEEIEPHFEEDDAITELEETTRNELQGLFTGGAVANA